MVFRGVALCVALTSVTGCVSEVELRGVVPTNRFEKSEPLRDTSVRVYDRDGVVYSDTRTGPTGDLNALAPRGSDIYLELGEAPATVVGFTGVSGFDEVLQLNRTDPPAVYGMPRAELEEWFGRFEGCPGLEEGALVVGQSRAVDLIDPTTEENPILNRVSATVVLLGGEVLEGCYLDLDGVAFNPAANETGTSGIFAVPGVPPGLHVLVLENELPGGIVSQASTRLFVDEARILPRFPLLMDSGLTTL